MADETRAKEHRLQAAGCIDEAIGLFEDTGQKFWLVKAYPLGVRVHVPLMGERPESVRKVMEYAARAVPLLRAYGKDDATDSHEELLEKLRSDQGQAQGDG